MDRRPGWRWSTNQLPELLSDRQAAQRRAHNPLHPSLEPPKLPFRRAPPGCECAREAHSSRVRSVEPKSGSGTRGGAAVGHRGVTPSNCRAGACAGVGA